MRAALLSGASYRFVKGHGGLSDVGSGLKARSMGAGPEEPTTDELLADVQVPQVPTDDPSLDGQPTTTESIASDTFNTGDYVGYVQIAAKLEQQGVIDTGDVNDPNKFHFSTLLSYMSLGAVLGSEAPGVGNAFGALYGALVYCMVLIGSRPPFEPQNFAERWSRAYADQNGPTAQYHLSDWWLMAYMPQEFLDYIDANFGDLVSASVPVLCYALLMYELQVHARVITPTGPNFYPGVNGQAWNYIYLQLARKYLDDPAGWLAEPLFNRGDPWDLVDPNDPEKSFQAGMDIYEQRFGVDYLRTCVERMPAGEMYRGIVSNGTNAVYQHGLGQFQYIPGAILDADIVAPHPHDLSKRGKTQAAGVGVGLGLLALLALLRRKSPKRNAHP